MPGIKYCLYRRSNGTYYQQDITTGAQESLRTKDKHAAKDKLRAANESAAQPQLNLDLARIYLRARDTQISARTLAGRDGSLLRAWPRVIARTLPTRLRRP